MRRTVTLALRLLCALWVTAWIVLRGGASKWYFRIPWLPVLVVSCVALSVWMDLVLPSQYLTLFASLRGKVVVVTGANTGVGFGTAQAAVKAGARVIMGCRSIDRCTKAIELINAQEWLGSAAMPTLNGEAQPLDLSNLGTILAFSQAVHEGGTDVSILVNNAGFAPKGGMPRTADGMEAGFGAMHVGHHYLSSLLLSHYPKLRVVNVASAMANQCYVRRCLERPAMPDSTDYLSYARAKLANELHAAQLPLLHRQASAASVELGFVQSNIQWWMPALAPAKLHVMRDLETGVTPVVYAMTAPLKYAGTVVTPIFQMRDPHVASNVLLRFIFYNLEVFRAFKSGGPGVFPSLSPLDEEQSQSMASRLWSVTEEILQDRATDA